MKAFWKGQLIAESDDIVIVEDNPYFPVTSLNLQYFKSGNTTSIGPWKGTASYYSIEVSGEVNNDAAWHYPAPKDAVKNIAGRVAFWRGVVIVS